MTAVGEGETVAVAVGVAVAVAVAVAVVVAVAVAVAVGVGDVAVGDTVGVVVGVPVDVAVVVRVVVACAGAAQAPNPTNNVTVAVPTKAASGFPAVRGIVFRLSNEVTVYYPPPAVHHSLSIARHPRKGSRPRSIRGVRDNVRPARKIHCYRRRPAGFQAV